MQISCAGTPVAISTGTVMSPPPPHTESMIPAAKYAAQMMSPLRLKSEKSVMRISLRSDAFPR